jgi:hypothetical protein
MADSEGVIMNGFTAEQEAALASKAEKFEFQAEVNRLMDIIINSLCKLRSRHPYARRRLNMDEIHASLMFSIIFVNATSHRQEQGSLPS